jgi:hypothetical protein
MQIPLSRYRTLLLAGGLVILGFPDLLHSYLLMPFPGSQELDLLQLAYTLEKLLPFSRTIGILLVLSPIIDGLLNGTLWRRAGMALLLGFVLAGAWFVQMYSADVMFRAPKHIAFASGGANTMPPETIVLGVTDGPVAKAYPVRLMAYHHFISDTVGGQQLLITYCSMCRTGRVFSPIMNGRMLHFRLVGANHYNAMIEDDATGSWWYQATGEAVAGPLKGAVLPEAHVEQMTLRAWTAQHPLTSILQPDAASAEGYSMFEGWDSARQRVSGDTIRDRSWVIGVVAGEHAKAYSWKPLVQVGVLNDTIDDVPVLIAVENDSVSFHAWQRMVHDEVLQFTIDSTNAGLRDTKTDSRWSMDGVCVAGPMEGQYLSPLSASQEFWHAWKHFHPRSTTWLTGSLVR